MHNYRQNQLTRVIHIEYWLLDLEKRFLSFYILLKEKIKMCLLTHNNAVALVNGWDEG